MEGYNVMIYFFVLLAGILSGLAAYLFLINDKIGESLKSFPAYEVSLL